MPLTFNAFILILGLLSGFLALTDGPARAQDAAEPASVVAPFVPTSGWLVGPAAVNPAGDSSSGSGGLPCLMINQFDNGQVIRISGGGGRIMAVAVDARRDVFEEGESYKVGLSLPPDFRQDFAAQAYGTSTLIINTQAVEGLYEKIKSRENFALDLGGQAWAFSLVGAADGLRRLEECFSGPVRASPPTVDEPAAPAVVRRVGNIPDKEPDKENVPDKNVLDRNVPERFVRAPAPAPAPAPDDGPAPVVPPPAAKPIPQQPPSPRVSTDIMEGTGGGEGSPGSTPATSRQWRAMKGANLREILTVWTAGAATDLIWMAGRDDFAVRQSISLQGSLETAVQALLEQYQDDSARPVGRLYSQSGIGRRALLIEINADADGSASAVNAAPP